jgi:two-component system nitrogen regulation sensor histidine kinase NtrY
MRKRVIYGSAMLLMVMLVTLLVWQASFSFGDFGPTSPQQTYLVWAVSTLIFLLTVTLGFMLFRNFVKLYVERHSNREGSRIRTKLVVGALALSFMPVVFLVLFSVAVLNTNINKWFSRPGELINTNYINLGNAIESAARDRAQAEAIRLSLRPDAHQVAAGIITPDARNWCTENSVSTIFVVQPDATKTTVCELDSAKDDYRAIVTAEASLENGAKLVVRSRTPIDLAGTKHSIDSAVERYNELALNRQQIRRTYVQLLTLITLFILFIATWIALFLAKQISVPIAALYKAAQVVRGGDLSYRIHVGANDELATLVRAFNEMTQDLETNSRELDNRRRFTEAILESIPTGVISLSSDGKIQRVNRALKGIFSAEQVDKATRLDQLFSRDEMKELRYLMNRSRRLGIAATQMDMRSEQRTLHLSVTVAALDAKVTSGYVLVIEDTSDLLRAQKAAAWHEVARRIAHEIKNPLTPIALSADRIARYLEKSYGSEDAKRVLHQCSSTISSEVQCLKTLVDEFSQFARFPAAQPVASGLNEVVENALGIFAGRLDGIEVRTQFASGLPLVNIDRDHFKRVVVNLVDNAAEAMQDSLVKQLLVRTSAPTPDTVELVIADTGCGVSREDREKLFLPYFSTKGRGTGLGLAIVNHIVSEHDAHIRVEDNLPVGARFVIEVPALAAVEPDAAAVETPA